MLVLLARILLKNENIITAQSPLIKRYASIDIALEAIYENAFKEKAVGRYNL